MMLRAPAFALIFGLALTTQPTGVSAAPGTSKMAEPVTGSGLVYSQVNPAPAAGPVEVIVRLSEDPITAGRAAIEAEQQAFLARAAQIPNTTVIARVKTVLNAVFLRVDAANIETIASDLSVSRVAPVGDYDLDLSETVPYIGGSAVQAAGIDGTGIRVAVLDSGIDYLHADLGGSGDVAEYAANDRDIIEPGTFPTAKVVGGFDFVGETWDRETVTVLSPDPDPLDLEGHGSHVADIIGGVNGVAPGVELLAVKVCSAVGSACSGIALIQGMDFSVDPNGDGDTSDRVDIINMSLGANYGQPFDDDLSAAVENATKLGVLTVASAGNSGDVPYVTGTPAAAKSAISVAQTNVPSAIQDRMEVIEPADDAGLYDAVRQPWSGQLTSAISGPVQYADGAGGNLDGCAPFAPDSLTGQIVVVDRGGCFFSDKIRNIEEAGGVLGIIALIAPGAPFPGGFGGGTPITIPGYQISQVDGDILRTGNAFVSFDPANGIPLAGSMVSSSSRGPRNGDNRIKPEIGAPGASVSAQATTGTLRTTFGGTSGAAPMVSGAAALLLEAQPWAGPGYLKTLLMNNADTGIRRDFTGAPAEVSRIGAGEVNVLRAFNSKVLVFTEDLAEIPMGYVPVSRGRKVIKREVEIVNKHLFARTFDISSSFDTPEGAASGAVTVRHRSRIRVPAGGEKSFFVRFIIDGDSLLTSSLSSGSDGANPATLNATEFGGYISIQDSIDSVDVPWHIIPRKSADVRGRKRLRVKGGSDEITLRNRGVGPANNDAFTLLALSEDIEAGDPGTQSPTPDLRGVGIRTTTVAAGFCSGNPSFLIDFAFNSWEPLTHVVPVQFIAQLDLDNDGSTDFDAFNGDFNVLVGEPGLDGRSVSIAADTSTTPSPLSAFFFAQHATNTNNTMITFCAEQLGLTLADLGTREITATFVANDFYFGGPDDVLEPVTFTLGGGYSATVDDIPANSEGVMTVTDNGGTGPGLGIMLFTNADRGPGNRGGATPATEALYFTPRGVQLPEPLK